MSDLNPLISVIMPVYNAEKYLAQAIESILKQTYTNIEFIILNDGSTDSSFKIIKHYEAIDFRLKVINSEVNKGLIYQLNLGLGCARGEFIARMDADDIANLTRLETQQRFLLDNSKVSVVGCGVITINGKGDFIGQAEFPSSQDHVFWESFFKCPISHPTTMFYRSVALAAGSYRPDSFPAEDFDLWTRILKTGEIVNLPDKLLCYRFHEGSTSVSMKDAQLNASYQVLRRHWEEFVGAKINEDVANFFHGYHRGVELPRSIPSYQVYVYLSRLRKLCTKRYGDVSEKINESFLTMSGYLFLIGIKRSQLASIFILLSLLIKFPLKLLQLVPDKLTMKFFHLKR